MVAGVALAVRRIHLLRPSVPAHIPTTAARVRDFNPEGRWELVKAVPDFHAGARFNGYNLEMSARVLPDGATFRCGKSVIVLRDGRYYTPDGRLTNPCFGEKG